MKITDSTISRSIEHLQYNLYIQIQIIRKLQINMAIL